jgi:hypothetical protein
MAKKEAYSPVRSGVDPRKDAANGQWLKLEANQYVDAAILVDVEDILACEQCAIWMDDGSSPVWVYTGPDDPSHDLKVEKRYRAFLPLLVENETRVWSMGKGAHMQLLEIADASLSGTKGVMVRIKRTGSGIQTRYSITPRGMVKDVSKVEEVDVLSMLGPLTPEGVQELVATKLGLASYEEVLERFRGKKITRATAKKIAAFDKSKPKDDGDDEDELDDLELA